MAAKMKLGETRETDWGQLIAGGYADRLAAAFEVASSFVLHCLELGETHLVFSADVDPAKDPEPHIVEIDDVVVHVLVASLDSLFGEMEEDGEDQGLNGFCERVQRSFILDVRKELCASPLNNRNKFREAVFDWIEKAQGDKA